MTDKRQYRRIETPTVSLKIASGEEFRQRYLRNLSQGGLYMRTSDVQPVGTEILVELSPPGWEEPVRVRGVVARIAAVEVDGQSTPVGMGIRFVELGPKNRERLAELLSEYQANMPLLGSSEEDDASPQELRREVKALRARLTEIREQVAMLYREIETLEDDDEANRTIIARLLQEKQEVLRAAEGAVAGKQQQISALKAENSRLLAELQQTIQVAERARADFLELHSDMATVIQQEQERAAHMIASSTQEAYARLDEVKNRLDKTEGRYQTVRKKERELRRLMKMMAGDKAEVPDSNGGGAKD